MSNKKFKDLEEAQAAYDALVADQDTAIQEAVDKAVKETVENKDKEIAALTKRAEDAEKIAEDAVEKFNSPDDIIVTIDKKKYKIAFGVEGKTKEELAEDKSLLAKLVKNGSAAIVAI